MLCSFLYDFLLSHFSWVILQLGSQDFQLALSHYNNNNDPIVRSCKYLLNIKKFCNRILQHLPRLISYVIARVPVNNKEFHDIEYNMT